MIKFLVVFITSSVVIINAASAQKDTSLYYLTNAGRVVSTKDSADFFLFILPPDTSVDKNLFVVKEYYSNGKIRVIGGSLTNDLNLKFQGPQVTFFPNGHKMSIRNFNNGELTGDILEFYPNGHFYNKKSYEKTVKEETELLLKDCSDSTGVVLAENGNGKWLNYDVNFKKVTEEGKIEKGYRTGEWKQINYYGNYNIKGDTVLKNYGNEIIDQQGNKSFVHVETVPSFPGGVQSFGRFLSKNVRYPTRARENGTQGRVIIAFVVERDGSLSNIRVVRGIGDGCDEEALRIIENSPKWKPGSQNGKPVRVAYSVPIGFTLSK